MSKLFDVELFLAAVLTGSNTTRQCHLRQAKAIQSAVHARWNKENPWSWKKKHLVWFLSEHSSNHFDTTKYYYLLTIDIISARLGKKWKFKNL